MDDEARVALAAAGISLIGATGTATLGPGGALPGGYHQYGRVETSDADGAEATLWTALGERPFTFLGAKLEP